MRHLEAPTPRISGPGLRTRLTLGFAVLPAILLAGGAVAQDATPLATDRPGFLFSSLTVGRGVLQTEWGIPAVTVDPDTRLTSLFGLVRYGVTQSFELRLDSPVYNESNGHGHGFGDLEIGAKWHLIDNQGARPSFALIPSVILPTGQKGFSVERPVYQLNAMAEWALPEGWGAGALAGYLNGPADGGQSRRYGQGTFAVSLGRSLPSPRWSAYGEAVHQTTDPWFVGGGIKYLVSNDLQLDLSFDRGLTSDSPDWLFGLGIASRF